MSRTNIKISSRQEFCLKSSSPDEFNLVRDIGKNSSHFESSQSYLGRFVSTATNAKTSAATTIAQEENDSAKFQLRGKCHCRISFIAPITPIDIS